MDKYTVRDSSGSVDVTASSNAYAAALTLWVTENEIPSDDIAMAVDSVLDSAAGKRVAMPSLLNFAAQELGADVSSLQAISTRIHEYVTAQVKAEKLFVVKGVGGGVSKERPVKKSA
ncbi:MAG TPA: hypothetical protein VII94_00320 [Candidatus Saccharimonadales bacterium]